MKILRPIINVRELPPLYSQLRKQLPSLRTYISATPAAHVHSVLEYLGQGVPCGICYDKGMLYDVLQPSRSIDATRVVGETGTAHVIQPNLLLTDGVWLWPGALLYYVKEYHLSLPWEFLHHAESHQWRIDASMVNTRELDTAAFDGIPSVTENVG